MEKSDLIPKVMYDGSNEPATVCHGDYFEGQKSDVRRFVQDSSIYHDSKKLSLSQKSSGRSITLFCPTCDAFGLRLNGSPSENPTRWHVTVLKVHHPACKAICSPVHSRNPTLVNQDCDLVQKSNVKVSAAIIPSVGTDIMYPCAAFGVIAVLAEVVHWGNAYLLREFDTHGHVHDLTDVAMHALLHAAVLGVICFQLRKSAVVILFVLRLLLEVGFHQFEDRIYGRRRKSPELQITADLVGTFGYTVAEVFITILAVAIADYFRGEKEKVHEVIGINNRRGWYQLLSGILQNRDGALLILFFHWMYIIAADVYIQCKIPWVFHLSHAINLSSVPLIIPFCQYVSGGRALARR